MQEGGNRVPAIAWMPGKIKAGVKTHDVVGGLDLMATIAAADLHVRRRRSPAQPPGLVGEVVALDRGAPEKATVPSRTYPPRTSSA